MKADEKVLVMCNEAGVEVGTGTIVLIAAMVWVYNAIHNLSEMAINLVK